MSAESVDPYAGLPPFLETVLAEDVNRWILPNGLTVVHKPDHSSKLVSIQVWVKSGSIHEGGLLGSGLSHFLEHMLFKGTKRRRGPEIAREVQEVGGNINAYTAFDRTVYHIDLPSEHAATALDILCDMVFGSELNPEEVDREREVILREIDMALDDPDRRISRGLLACAYREHPYRFPVIGHRELFEQLGHGDVAAYFEQRYVPNNMVLVVAGDISRFELEDILEAGFGAEPRRRLPPTHVPQEPPQLARRETRLFGEVQICRVSFAYKIPGLGHPEAPALDLLAAILGRGNSSSLWQSLREKQQLVHHIDAACWNPSEKGLFWISFLCDPEKQEAAEAALLRELDQIVRRGIPEPALQKARKQAMVAEVNARKTMGGQAMRLGLAEVVVGDLWYPHEYFTRLQEGTTATLERLLREYCVTEHLSVASLTSGESRCAHTERPAIREMPPFHKEVLSNGVRLLWQHDPRLPKLHLRTGFLGGPLYESPGRRGITSLLATMLVRDTEQRDAAEVAEAIESVGGAFHEFAGNNSFGVSLEVMAEDFPLAEDLLRGGLLYPRFEPETVAIERDAQIAQIREDLDEIVEFGRKALRRRFFGDHPFAVDGFGEIDDLRGIDPDALREHHAALCRAGNLVLAVSGDLGDAAVLERLRELLTRFPKSGFEPCSAPTPDRETGGEWVERLPREQAVLFHAFPEPGIRDPDYLVGELLDEIFSDMSGSLFCRVREERGLAYFVGASRISGIDTGMFYLLAGTHPDHLTAVAEEFDREIARARAGEITEEELQRCRTRLKAQRRTSLQVMGARAMQAVLDELFGLPENTWMQYDSRIDAVNLEDVVRYACRYFDPARRVALTVRP